MKVNEIILESKFGIINILFSTLKWIISAAATIWWLSLVLEPFKEYYTNMQTAENSLNNRSMSKKDFDNYHIKQLSELIGKVAIQVISNKIVAKGLPVLSKIPMLGVVIKKIPTKIAQGYVLSKLNTPEAAHYIAIAIMQPVFQQFVKSVGIPVEQFIKNGEKEAEEYFNKLISFSNTEMGTNLPQIDTSKPWIDVSKDTSSLDIAPNGKQWADSSQLWGSGFDPRAKK